MVRTPWTLSASAPLTTEARLPCPQEGTLGVRQPHDAHQQQHRHHGKSEQAELEVERQQDGDDANEEDEVPDREDGGLQELLQRIDVALEPGHEPAHLGLVHEGERDVLQVPVHRAPQIEEQAPGDPSHHALLHEVRRVVERDHHEEGEDDEAQHRKARFAGHERVVDRVAQHERDRDLGEGEDEHRRHPDVHAPAIGRHEVPEAAYHPPVEGGPEHLFFVGDLGADHRPRRPERRGRRSRCDRLHVPPLFADSGAPSLIRVCSA